MTADYMTSREAIKIYNLNISKLRFAMINHRKNGLYKSIYRKRTRVFFRKDFFEKWMETNDVVSPSRKR